MILALFKLDEVKEYLKEKKHDFIVDVRYRPSDDMILIYIPQEKIVEKARKGFISHRQLVFLEKQISSTHGKSVDIVVMQGEGHQELETGLYQILNRKFNDKIIALYISFVGERRVNAWIEIDKSIEGVREEIHGHLLNILGEANIELDAVSWVITQAELPSMFALLRKIKVHQPANLQELERILLQDYSSASDKWLNNKLDLLRKKGLVRREKNGCYVLSAMALTIIPAGTRYSSSDIERALALGKRKW